MSLILAWTKVCPALQPAPLRKLRTCLFHASAMARVISHVRASCGCLLLDSPTTCGGNTNAGPVTKRFFWF